MLAEARALARRGYSGARIRETIIEGKRRQAATDGVPFLLNDVPQTRTFERLIKDNVSPPVEYWSLRDADPQEAAVVLPVFVEMLRDGETRLTREEASWIYKLRTVAPHMPGFVALQTARVYIGTEPGGIEEQRWDIVVAGWSMMKPLDIDDAIDELDAEIAARDAEIAARDVEPQQ